MPTPTIQFSLGFNNQAQDAVPFYVNLFQDAEITYQSSFWGGPPGEETDVPVFTFRLRDMYFSAMNGGPYFSFSMGQSVMVSCETQEEIDRLYNGLAEGGMALPCGWVQDRFGMFWQITSAWMGRLMQNSDKGQAQAAMTALMGMHKVDIAALQAAANAHNTAG